MDPSLVSVQVGVPQVFDIEGRPYVTAIYKAAVPGAVRVNRENIEGDAQADRSVHGGVDKAICVYCADHFPAWCQELGVVDCQPGAFGENFSVTGQHEDNVCIGDVFRIGSVVVQVSQPRGPCHKLARRWQRLDFVHLVVKSNRTGWYLRVLTPGFVTAGDAIELVDRPCPDWTIARVNTVSYFGSDAAEIGSLAACSALAGDWRASLVR